jgi:hypothetical protein
MIFYPKYLQKEILESLEDVGSGPLGRHLKVLGRGNEERNKGEEDAISKARVSHLVVAVHSSRAHTRF